MIVSNWPQKNKKKCKIVLMLLIIFLFIPAITFAQKSNNPKKAEKPKSTAPKKEVQEASIEVISYIKKSDFYDLSKVIDISYLENLPAGTGVLHEYYGPQSINCHQKLDDEASMLLREVRSKKDNLDYTLTVDWEECKIISLKPHSSKMTNMKYSYTLYHINLIPETGDKNEKKTTQPSKKAVSSLNKPLLITQVDTHGEWIATCPYGSSMPGNSEKEVIAELFYDTPGAITFLYKRNNFNIYVINIKTDNPRIEVRDVLKNLGVTDIPE